MSVQPEAESRPANSECCTLDCLILVVSRAQRARLPAMGLCLQTRSSRYVVHAEASHGKHEPWLGQACVLAPITDRLHPMLGSAEERCGGRHQAPRRLTIRQHHGDDHQLRRSQHSAGPRLGCPQVRTSTCADGVGAMAQECPQCASWLGIPMWAEAACRRATSMGHRLHVCVPKASLQALHMLSHSWLDAPQHQALLCCSGLIVLARL